MNKGLVGLLFISLLVITPTKAAFLLTLKEKQNTNKGGYFIYGGQIGIFSIYDVSGRMVKRQILTPENKLIIINASELNAGAYYYEIKTNENKVKAEKLIIVK